MTVDTNTEIHALIAELAAMTVACPLCQARDKHLASLRRKVDATIYCAECEGNKDDSGTVPKFPGARRKCLLCRHNAKSSEELHYYYIEGDSKSLVLRRCPNCSNTRWHPDYDLHIEALLESLTKLEYRCVISIIPEMWELAEKGKLDDPVPSKAEIKLAWLRDIVKVAKVCDPALTSAPIR